MRPLALVLFASAANALAHPGHGMPAAHLHWWEYAIVGALIGAAAVFGVAAAIYARRK